LQVPGSKRQGSEDKSTGQSRQIGTTYDLLYGLRAAPPALAPSPFLTDCVGRRKPGTALDIGSGNGRNTLYLARRGWHVTAVDLSRVGLDQTQMMARQLGVKVRTVAQDINRFDFGHERWDLILLIDFPFAYQELLPRIRAGLRPGGWIVLEEVSDREAAELKKSQHLSPILPYRFMRRKDLDTAFAGFQVLRDEEGFFATPWGGHAWMIRYLAEKPARPGEPGAQQAPAK